MAQAAVELDPGIDVNGLEDLVEGGKPRLTIVDGAPSHFVEVVDAHYIDFFQYRWFVERQFGKELRGAALDDWDSALFYLAHDRTGQLVGAAHTISLGAVGQYLDIIAAVPGQGVGRSLMNSIFHFSGAAEGKGSLCWRTQSWRPVTAWYGRLSEAQVDITVNGTEYTGYFVGHDQQIFASALSYMVMRPDNFKN